MSDSDREMDSREFLQLPPPRVGRWALTAVLFAVGSLTLLESFSNEVRNGNAGRQLLLASVSVCTLLVASLNLRRLLLTNDPPLRFTSMGIEETSMGLGLIPWEDIVKIVGRIISPQPAARGPMPHKTLFVYVRDPRNYFARLSAIRRLALFLRTPRLPLVVAASLLFQRRHFRGDHEMAENASAPN